MAVIDVPTKMYLRMSSPAGQTCSSVCSLSCKRNSLFSYTPVYLFMNVTEVSFAAFVSIIILLIIICTFYYKVELVFLVTRSDCGILSCGHLGVQWKKMYIEFHNNGAFQALRNAVREGVRFPIKSLRRCNVQCY